MTRSTKRLVRSALLVMAALLTAMPVAAQLPYAEDFSAADGSPWPAPWFNGSAHVTVQDIQDGRGRLNGGHQQVARMILPGFSETDIEATMTFEFENVTGQGIGFYARQNGGLLQEYVPFGQGYAMFLKGPWGWPDDLGLWYEIAGVETQFLSSYFPVPSGLENGVRYRLRFRVTQQDPATTRLQARVWPEGSPEPAAWTSDGTNTQPLLQNTPGGFAIDIYNHSGAGHIFIDDLLIERYPATTNVPNASHTSRLALAAPWPNPVRETANIGLSIAEATEIDLTLRDIAGRVVAEVFRGRLVAGAHTIPLTIAGRALAPGVYQMVACSGDAMSARRLVVTR